MCTSLARQAILVETCAWNSFQLQDTDALCCQISCCCLPVQRLGHLRAPCPRRVPIGACLGNYIACRLCRVLDGSLFRSHTRGRGLTFTSAHVLVRAPVDGPGFPPTDISGPHSVCRPCSRAHFGRVPTACVSSPKRLGCLPWLAHAAGHGHFKGASTSRRTVSFDTRRSRQKTTIHKIGDSFS